MATTPQKPLGEREFVAMMALLQALQALAIDAMLPALGVMAHDLGSDDPNHRQLVVSIFLIGIGVGSLIPGALADRYGRRPVLMTCLALYIITSLGCVLVQDFETLVVLRGLQGLGCAGLGVLPPAIIRDRLEGDRMARLQSLVSVVFMVVPMLAPSLGQGVLLIAGWRWIFGIFAVQAIIMAVWVWRRLPETLDPENRQTIRLRAIAANMGMVLTTRSAIGYVLGSTLMMSAMWGFINSCQQLIAEHFGAGQTFPLVFGGLALTMIFANLGNARIVTRFGARRVSHAALLAYIVVSSVQVLTASSGHEVLWQFIALMAANMTLSGFIGANFGAIALQPFGRIAGAAASVQTFVRLGIASVAGALIGQAYDGTALPLAMALLGAGTMTLLLVLFSEKGRLFRRLNPPPAAK